MIGGSSEAATEALEALGPAIETLAALDVNTLADGPLDDVVVVELSGLSTRLEAAWCAAIGAWDRRVVWALDGSKSPTAHLARETHRPKGEAVRLVCRSRQLRTMPATTTAYRSGELCAAKS